MPTVEDLGRKVKAKYPGAYDDLPDADVGVRVKGKYPGAYDDFTDIQKQSPTAGPLDSIAKAPVVAMDTLRGAGKGALQSLSGVASVMSRVPGLGYMKPPPNLDTEARTPGEAVGKTVEQAAEFLIPGGAINRGAQAIRTAITGVRAAPVLNVAGRAALEAGGAGLVRAAQTGGDPVETAKAAGTAGAVSGALGAVTAAAPALKESAKRSYSRVLGATKERNKHLSDKAIPELIERGVMAGTRKGLKAKADATVADVGKQLGEAHAALPPSMSLPMEKVTGQIDDAAAAKFKIRDVNSSPIADSALRTVDDLKSRILALSKVDPKTGERIVAYQDLRALRQQWDDIVSSGGGFAGADLTNKAAAQAHKISANAIRDQLNQATPDIAAINKEYSFWKNVQKVMGDTLKRTQSQAQPMGEQIARAAGAASGLATGGVHTAVLQGEGLALFRKLTTSAAWGTTSAIIKDRLANLLASGNAKEATALMSKLAAAGVSAGPPPMPQFNPSTNAPPPPQ